MQKLVPPCKSYYGHSYDQGRCIYCANYYIPPELKKMLAKVEAMIDGLNGLQSKVGEGMWTDFSFAIDQLEAVKHTLEVSIKRNDKD